VPLGKKWCEEEKSGVEGVEERKGLGWLEVLGREKGVVMGCDEGRGSEGKAP
jgi:hypothetical protein